MIGRHATGDVHLPPDVEATRRKGNIAILAMRLGNPVFTRKAPQLIPDLVPTRVIT